MTVPEPESPPKVEIKAVILLVLMVSLVTGFLLYVMYARGVFEVTQRLVLVSDDSEGVRPGMDMTFTGFPIGRVSQVELAPDGKARILLDVPKKDAKWLRISSVFTLERGLVGETRIKAYSGILTDPPLPDGAERTVLRGDTAAEIPRLVATARTLLENLESMTRSDSSINTSLANVQAATARFAGKYGLLGGALGSDEEAKKLMITLDRVNALLANADKRVFGKNGVMDETQAAVIQLNVVLKDASDTLKKVDAVLVEAQAVGKNARVATDDLGALRAEVDSSLRKVTRLVDEINRKWPFAKKTELKLP
ncbi:mammalian cell entry protein [Massilia eurypsychrophila]|jgi:phospholipid/cholesterol/gamma-HCH transport system substrate-binding protein|uniref:Mammalian cell entry protein n=1 Tax=Massilia eurypsychrophila TaxID=1485217 RepID=A0A2G8TIP7_9BURK|nr:mammalian cell entry protein [Massilia eurypsychrophila]PIL45819.1 mammalian cell entry protein [Massilia eurypsychrophila]